ncbi:unnamed protein product [Sphenostylis stenocarpa]|uniref:Uncharacterized protein n=1 Tax=Sphenostylis stenocarpa TaxID=92480 RepID=A0AA86VZI0_9FABA|nr:unnamed protein product [Sphenostylis stenocarpa]
MFVEDRMGTLEKLITEQGVRLVKLKMDLEYIQKLLLIRCIRKSSESNRSILKEWSKVGGGVTKMMLDQDCTVTYTLKGKILWDGNFLKLNKSLFECLLVAFMEGNIVHWFHLREIF